jgi:hypothetical protein
VAVGAFLLDKAADAFWFQPWAKLKEDIEKTNIELSKAKATLAREKPVRDAWKRVEERLSKRPADVSNAFVTHLGSICSRVGVNLDLSSAPQAVQQGDFREYVFETRFKLKWGEFVDLLAELHNSREFLKPLRISIGSQYEREERLDLDLKVSTIEFAPVQPKSGVK